MAERIPDVSHMVPVRADVPWREEDGRVLIEKQKFGPAGRRLLKTFRVPPVLKVHLDPVGSKAWLLMDGRDVAAILRGLQEAFPEEDELPERLGKYLGTLVSNGLVELT